MTNQILSNFTKRAPRRRALTLLELVVVLLVLATVAGIAAPLFSDVSTQAAGTPTLQSLRALQSVILSTYVPNMKGVDISAGMGSAAVTDPDGFPRGARTSSSSIDAQPMLVWLFRNPASEFGGTTQSSYSAATGLGWNGPYLMSGMGNYPGVNANPAARGFVAGKFGNYGDPTVLDGWGNPIVIVYISEPSYTQPYYVLLSAGATGTLDPVISATASGTAVAAVVTQASTTSPRILNIGSSQYQYWMPLQ